MKTIEIEDKHNENNYGNFLSHCIPHSHLDDMATAEDVRGLGSGGTFGGHLT